MKFRLRLPDDCPAATYVWLSVIIHASAFLALILSKAPVRPDVVQVVELNYSKPPPPQKRARRAPKPKMARELVQQDELTKAKNDLAKWLSEHDQKVKEETRSDLGKFNNVAAKGKPLESAPIKEKEKSEEKGKEKGDESLPDLGPQFAAAPAAAGENGQKVGEKMRTDDYLKDVRKGMRTVLNTRQFAYFTYYRNIKEKVSRNWEPSVRARAHLNDDGDRAIASDQDRVTKLLVILDKEGNLLRIDIVKTSGLDELDATAVESFRSAAPFPKPPKGLVESDGTIKIRYDFVIQT